MHTDLIKHNTLFEYVVTPEQGGLRADRLVSQQFPLYSRSFLQQLFEDKLVAINNKPVAKSTRVKPTDHIVIQFPAQPEVDRAPLHENQIDVRLIFEHEHFLILHKPAGLIVHSPYPESTELSLVDWIMHHYEQVAHVGNIDRPGIVHRLDRNTSGIIVIARTNHGRAQLSSLFKERKMNKTYLALVHGHPEKTGSIELPIGRDPYERKQMRAFKDGALPDADQNVIRRDDVAVRYALTHYTVKEYFAQHSLVELKPVTGRTHQIRVHCAAIGHPLVGDHLYGTPSPLLNRHALHAYSLSFTFDGTLFSFCADAGLDFTNALEQVSKNSSTRKNSLAFLP